MLSKFKIDDIVKDNCGCEYVILCIGRIYYTCTHLSLCEYADEEFFKFKVEIEELDNRAKLVKKETL